MTDNATQQIDISSICIGTRQRKDLGDIPALAASIEEHGLLQPIVITPDRRLVAGLRRLRALELLGRRTVPVHIADIASIVRGERAENQDRLPFTLSESVAIWEAVKAEEETAVKGRMSLGGKGAKFSQPLKGRAVDRAARGTGKSGRTLEKAKAIVEAAEQDPEKFRKLQEDMDRTGRVNGPFKRLMVTRKAENIQREAPPLPNKGPYRVIVADPPWPYEVRSEDPSHRSTQPYPQMSIEQIRALKVGEIAHDDSIVWLWTTNHHMREAFQVLDAWGFQQKTILTWVKDRMSTGDWLRGKTEHCLMATRGRPIVTLHNQTTVLHAPRREHSQKPDEFYELVEHLCPASRYAELFQRTAREKWDGHGDEVRGFTVPSPGAETEAA